MLISRIHLRRLLHLFFHPMAAKRAMRSKGNRVKAGRPPDSPKPVRPMEEIVQEGKEVLNDVIPFYFHSLPPNSLSPISPSVKDQEPSKNSQPFSRLDYNQQCLRKDRLIVRDEGNDVVPVFKSPDDFVDTHHILHQQLNVFHLCDETRG